MGGGQVVEAAATGREEERLEARLRKAEAEAARLAGEVAAANKREAPVRAALVEAQAEAEALRVAAEAAAAEAEAASTAAKAAEERAGAEAARAAELEAAVLAKGGALREAEAAAEAALGDASALASALDASRCAPETLSRLLPGCSSGPRPKTGRGSPSNTDQPSGADGS